MPLNVVVLGGTKGMGRAVARRLAARGDRVHLLGRDADELAKGAADLQARAATDRDNPSIALRSQIVRAWPEGSDHTCSER